MALDFDNFRLLPRMVNLVILLAFLLTFFAIWMWVPSECECFCPTRPLFGPSQCKCPPPTTIIEPCPPSPLPTALHCPPPSEPKWKLLSRILPQRTDGFAPVRKLDRANDCTTACNALSLTHNTCRELCFSVPALPVLLSDEVEADYVRKMKKASNASSEDIVHIMDMPNRTYSFRRRPGSYPHVIGTNANDDVLYNVSEAAYPPLMYPPTLNSTRQYRSGVKKRGNGEYIRYVHTTWKTLCLPLWHVFIPSYAVHDGQTRLVYWTDDAIDRFVKTHFYGTKVYLAFQRLNLKKAHNAGWYGASRADLFRVLIIWLWGGLYVDFDVDMERPVSTIFNAREAFSLWEPKFDANDTDPRILSGILGAARPDLPFWRFVVNKVFNRVLAMSNEELATCNPVDCTSVRLHARLYFEFTAADPPLGNVYLFTFDSMNSAGITHHGHCSWCTNVEKEEKAYDIRSMLPSHLLVLPYSSDERTATCYYHPSAPFYIDWDGLYEYGGDREARMSPVPISNRLDYLPVSYSAERHQLLLNTSLATELSGAASSRCPYGTGCCGETGLQDRDILIDSTLASSFQQYWEACANEKKFARAHSGSWLCFSPYSYREGSKPVRNVSMADNMPMYTLAGLESASESSRWIFDLVVMLYGTYKDPGVVVEIGAPNWTESASHMLARKLNWGGISLEPHAASFDAFCASAPQPPSTNLLSLRATLAPTAWTYGWSANGLRVIPFEQQLNDASVAKGFPLDMLLVRLVIRAIDLLIIRLGGHEHEALYGLNLTETVVRAIILAVDSPQSFHPASAYILSHGYQLVGAFPIYHLYVLPSEADRELRMWSVQARRPFRLRNGSDRGPHPLESPDYVRQTVCPV